MLHLVENHTPSRSSSLSLPTSKGRFPAAKKNVPVYRDETSERSLRIAKRLLAYGRSQIVDELKTLQTVENLPVHLQSQMYNNVERAMTSVDVAQNRTVYYNAFVFNDDELIMVEGFGKKISYKSSWKLGSGISPSLKKHLKERLQSFKHVPLIAVGRASDIQVLIDDKDLCGYFDHKLCVKDDDTEVDFYTLLKKYSENLTNDSDYEAVKCLQESRPNHVLHGLSQISAWLSDDHSSRLLIDESYFAWDSSSPNAMTDAVNELVATAFYFGIKVHFLPKGLLPKDKRLSLVLEN